MTEEGFSPDYMETSMAWEKKERSSGLQAIGNENLPYSSAVGTAEDTGTKVYRETTTGYFRL